MSARDHVLIDGEVYAVNPCPRIEIVRAWREVGGGVSALVGALAHPGERFERLGEDPPDGSPREPRRPLRPLQGSQIELEAPPP